MRRCIEKFTVIAKAKNPLICAWYFVKKGFYKDYLLMFMEILLTVMICEQNDDSCFDDSAVAGSAPDQMFTQRNTGKSVMPELSNIIKKYMDIGIISKGIVYPDEPICYTVSERDLFGLIAYMWYRLHKNSSKFRIYINGENTYESSVPELKKFTETIRMMN